MSTRAKFTCTEITKRKHWDKSKGFTYAARLEPVVGGSPENDQFYAATPGGSIVLETIVVDHFEVGKTYYVDFTPAEG